MPFEYVLIVEGNDLIGARSMAKNQADTVSDGGCHAIKGFVFQFDSTLLEAFADETRIIGVERDQDIDIDNFYVQVKLRTASFSISSIAKAVRQIFKHFTQDPARRYRLYGHFADKAAGETRLLTNEELTRVLGADSSGDDDAIRTKFLDNFEVLFAPDLDAQFADVINALKLRHELKNDDEAIAYHAILYRYLTDLVLRLPQADRVITAASLDKAVRTANQAIFQGGYERRLGKKRYLALLKTQVASRKLNIISRQRLVMVEVDADTHIQDIVDLAAAVAGRFHVPGNSPAPYLLLRGIADAAAVKRALWDADRKFVDGTNFNGDCFRIDCLTGKTPRGVGLRLVDEDSLAELTRAIIVQEVYEFFLTRPYKQVYPTARLRQMAVESVNDAVDVMSVGGRR